MAYLRAAPVGEMMAEQPKNEGGRPLETGFSNNPVLSTLASAVIDKNLAHPLTNHLLGLLVGGLLFRTINDLILIVLNPSI
jgi:hypothetical protein